MRMWLSILLLAAFAPAAGAEDPVGGNGDKPAADKQAGEPDAGAEPAAEEPKEPPAYKVPERSRRKVERLLTGYLHPRRGRQHALDDFEKFLARPVEPGHSVLEDVALLSEIAGRNRRVGKTLPRGRGKLREVKVDPAQHGFPGIGTVRYLLWLPKAYDGKTPYPLVFCMPDNKRWPDPGAYLHQVWIDRGASLASKYAIAAPLPQTKGEAWTRPKQLPRAMITLRHAMGTFDADDKNGGPSIDVHRVFIAGADAAALVASRFAELFAGAVLRGCDGVAVGGPNLRKVGGLNRLPAYCLVQTKKGLQKQFASRLRADNDASLVLESDDAKLLGDVNAIEAWMDKLPPRPLAPREIEYTVHDGSFQRHHWINVLEFDALAEPAPGFLATADRARNEIRIEVNGLVRFELFLNDALVDLNRELHVVVAEDGKEYDLFPGGKERVARSLSAMLEELVASNHPWRIYTAKMVVDLPQLRARAAAEEAAKKKAAQEEKASEAGGEASAGDDAGKKPAGADAAMGR